MRPMKAPMPSSDATGLSRPANCTQGMMVPIMVTNMAAIWLLVNVEANRPKPVEQMTKMNAARVSVKKLPLTGTPNTVTANTTSSRKLTIASAM